MYLWVLGALSAPSKESLDETRNSRIREDRIKPREILKKKENKKLED